MRSARIVGRGAAYYHCMTRVIERKMLLNKGEKERFRKIMRKVAAFAGIEILTYATLSNHLLCGAPHNTSTFCCKYQSEWSLARRRF